MPATLELPNFAAKDIDELEARCAGESLSPFIQAAWNVIEPGTEYQHNWHIDLIAEHLEAVTAGQIKRLLVNIPPRYMKSGIVSVLWPVWEWLQTPHTRWIFASYAIDLARDLSVKRRHVIRSPWFQERWGNRFQLSDDQDTKTEFENNRRGKMLCVGMGGSAAGKGANRLVVDDPHDPRQAESKAMREAQIQFFSQTLYSRLNDKKNDAICIVMQRVHEADLSAHVLKEGGYVHINLPAEADRRAVISFPRSGRQIVRQVGDILWPAREGPAELALTKRSMGSYAYAGQYQQRPAPSGGGLFKRQWFRHWKWEGDKYRLTSNGQSWLVEPERCQRFATLDVAGSESQGADYSVLQIFDLTIAGDVLLIHQWRAQAQIPDVATAAVRECHRFKTTLIGIEKNGLGLGVCQLLRTKGLLVRPMVAAVDKVTRSQTAQVLLEAGQLHFPAEAPYLAELCEELEAFPKALHDDQADALSWGAILAMKLGAMVRNTPEDEANIEASVQRVDDETDRIKQAIEDEELYARHASSTVKPVSVTDPANVADPIVAAWLRGESVPGIR